MRKISEIIIHFSESSYGDADVIRRWHLNRKRADGSPMFSDIAYHFVICNGVRRFGEAYSDSADGLLQAGRPIEKLGGGVKGHHDETLEVCVVGKTKFTDKQFATLREFIGDQLAANPDIKIAMHGP
jgi:hypothetical protein